MVFSFSFFFSSWERASQASQGWAWTSKSSVSTFWAMELQTWPPWLVYVVLEINSGCHEYMLGNHSTNWATSPTHEENLLLHWGNWILFLKHKESVIYRALKMPLDDRHPVYTFSLPTWKLCRVFYIHHLSATQNGIHSLQVGKLRLRLLQLFAPYHTARKSPRPWLRGLWLHKDTFLIRSRVSWPPFSVC